MKNLLLSLGLVFSSSIFLFVQPVLAGEKHDHENEADVASAKGASSISGAVHADGHLESENETHISEDMAKKVGINTATVKAQVLHQTITSYGVLATGSEQLSHMRARFSGLITSVDASIGDVVQAGDLLAQIESDQSLKKYSVRAPISGTVVQRHANKGEVTKDQVLFSIANFDTLWAEFRIYPAQRDKVSAGQGVEIISGNKKIVGKISHVIPALDRPFQLARVELNNEQLTLSPGFLVEGRIVVDKVPVDLAVEKSGVQKIGGRSGVFVKTKEAYRFTPLILGRADDNYVEVLGGLDRDESYVNQNSYLIKADIEKSEAEHDH